VKICIIVDDYLPRSIKVAGKMMHELALEFQKNGHSVSVITPDDQLKFGCSKQNFESIQVIRFSSGRIKNVWKPIRLINEYLLSFRARVFLRRWIEINPQDLIVFYSPTIFFSGLVEYLKAKWQCKSFLIVRDFFPQWTIDNGLLKEDSVIAKFFRFYEKRMYKCADKIGIQSPANLEWFKNKFPEFGNTTLLYNWATENANIQTSQIEKKSIPKNDISIKVLNLREEYNLNGKIIFFYGGNIGTAQHMQNLLDLAEGLLKEDTAFFIFLGNGDEFQFVSQQIRSKNLHNSILLPSVSQEEYLFILDQVDVGLITLHPHHKTHNFPGKILGYMQKGLPILGIVNPGNDLQSIINKAGAGYIETNNDYEELIIAARRMLSKSVRNRMGNASRELLKSDFSVSKAISVILS